MGAGSGPRTSPVAAPRFASPCRWRRCRWNERPQRHQRFCKPSLADLQAYTVVIPTRRRINMVVPMVELAFGGMLKRLVRARAAARPRHAPEERVGRVMHPLWRSILLFAMATVLTRPAAAESPPRSVLILDQSDADSAWYSAFSTAFRSTLNAAASGTPVSIYTEHLDLSRFGNARHDEVLLAYLRDKFRERPIGVIVAQGSGSLEFVMR